MRLWPFGKSQVTPSSGPGDTCSFCGRTAAVVGVMVEGPGTARICAPCVRLAYQVAESNRNQPASANVGDPAVAWNGHLLVSSYFHLRQEADGQWVADSEHHPGICGRGNAAAEAAHDFQSQVLTAAAAAFANRPTGVAYLTNHADRRLWPTPAVGGAT